MLKINNGEALKTGDAEMPCITSLVKKNPSYIQDILRENMISYIKTKQ